MKRILLCAAVLVSCVVAEAADTTKTLASMSNILYRNNIGAGWGFVTGYGVSYRHWWNEKHGLQINGMPYYYEEQYNGGDGDYYERDSGYSNTGMFSLGATYLRLVAKQFDLRILTYAGANINTDYEKSHYCTMTREYSNSDYTATNVPVWTYKYKFHNKLTLGGGLGGEFQVWRLTANLMVGLQAFYVFETENKGIIPSIEIAGFFGY